MGVFLTNETKTQAWDRRSWSFFSKAELRTWKRPRSINTPFPSGFYNIYKRLFFNFWFACVEESRRGFTSKAVGRLSTTKIPQWSGSFLKRSQGPPYRTNSTNDVFFSLSLLSFSGAPRVCVVLFYLVVILCCLVWVLFVASTYLVFTFSLCVCVAVFVFVSVSVSVYVLPGVCCLCGYLRWSPLSSSLSFVSLFCCVLVFLCLGLVASCFCLALVFMSGFCLCLCLVLSCLSLSFVLGFVFQPCLSRIVTRKRGGGDAGRLFVLSLVSDRLISTDVSVLSLSSSCPSNVSPLFRATPHRQEGRQTDFWS